MFAALGTRGRGGRIAAFETVFEEEFDAHLASLFGSARIDATFVQPPSGGVAAIRPRGLGVIAIPEAMAMDVLGAFLAGDFGMAGFDTFVEKSSGVQIAAVRTIGGIAGVDAVVKKAFGAFIADRLAVAGVEAALSNPSSAMMATRFTGRRIGRFTLGEAVGQEFANAVGALILRITLRYAFFMEPAGVHETAFNAGRRPAGVFACFDEVGDAGAANFFVVAVFDTLAKAGLAFAFASFGTRGPIVAVRQAMREKILGAATAGFFGFAGFEARVEDLFGGVLATVLTVGRRGILTMG